MNIGAGIVASIATYPGIFSKASKKLEISTEVFVLPLIMSCVFLWDAFRRFGNTKDENQTINNKQVGILSIAFGAFVVCLLAQTIGVFIGELTVSLSIYEVTVIAFCASNVLLAIVLYKLIVD